MTSAASILGNAGIGVFQVGPGICPAAVPGGTGAAVGGKAPLLSLMTELTQGRIFIVIDQEITMSVIVRIMAGTALQASIDLLAQRDVGGLGARRHGDRRAGLGDLGQVLDQRGGEDQREHAVLHQRGNRPDPPRDWTTPQGRLDLQLRLLHEANVPLSSLGVITSEMTPIVQLG